MTPKSLYRPKIGLRGLIYELPSPFNPFGGEGLSL